MYIHLFNLVNTIKRLILSHVHVTIFPFQIYVTKSQYENFQIVQMLNFQPKYPLLPLPLELPYLLLWCCCCCCWCISYSLSLQLIVHKCTVYAVINEIRLLASLQHELLTQALFEDNFCHFIHLRYH